jgi:hypothetical protein
MDPYVSNRGAGNLCQDFQQDRTFIGDVCNDVSQFTEDRKKASIREIMKSAIVDNAPSVNTASPSFFEILVNAALKACEHGSRIIIYRRPLSGIPFRQLYQAVSWKFEVLLTAFPSS